MNRNGYLATFVNSAARSVDILELHVRRLNVTSKTIERKPQSSFDSFPKLVRVLESS